LDRRVRDHGRVYSGERAGDRPITGSNEIASLVLTLAALVAAVDIVLIGR
jgi:hypothetical protein